MADWRMRVAWAAVISSGTPPGPARGPFRAMRRQCQRASCRDPVISPCPLFPIWSCQRSVPGTRAHFGRAAGLSGNDRDGTLAVDTASHLIAPMQARAWTVPGRAPFVPHAPGLAAGAAGTLPWGQIKDQSPLCDAVPGRFTGAVFVAEERHLEAGFDAAQSRLADLARSGALSTSSVDCYGAGYDWSGPARPAGLATPSPDRAGSGPEGASWAQRRRK